MKNDMSRMNANRFKIINTNVHKAKKTDRIAVERMSNPPAKIVCEEMKNIRNLYSK